MEKEKYLKGMLELLKKQPYIYRKMIEKIEKELKEDGSIREKSSPV